MGVVPLKERIMAGQEKIEHNTGVALGVRVPLGAHHERQPNYVPAVRLRRSSNTTSRHRPCMHPSRERVPTIRNLASVWSFMLAVFSGKMPACRVQMPSDSDSTMSLAIRLAPTPQPRTASAT